MQPLLTKWKVPNRSKSQREDVVYSKTRLLDYHDSAANVTNSAFYSNRVTTSGAIAISKQKHCVIYDQIHKNNITCCALSAGKAEK